MLQVWHVFFFQAEDGIRDVAVTGVQTCALPISLNQRMRREIPEAIAFAFGPPAIPGLGTAGGFTFMLQDRSSGSVQQLAETLDKFTVAARKRSEIASLVTTFRSSVPQLFVDVDQDRVLKQGLQFGEVYQTLQAFLGGAYVNQFNRFGRQWKVYLQAEPEYRSSVDRINDFFVRNSKEIGRAHV